MEYRLRDKRGFTLIELLVVVSIVSTLSSVVLGATSSARAKAEDAKILAQRRQVVSAMELYYSDQSGYPGGSGFYCVGNTNCKLANVNVTTKLSGLSISDFTLADISVSGAGTNKGIVYKPCSAPINGRCPVATGPNDATAARIISATKSGGLVEHLVGIWVPRTYVPEQGT